MAVQATQHAVQPRIKGVQRTCEAVQKTANAAHPASYQGLPNSMCAGCCACKQAIMHAASQQIEQALLLAHAGADQATGGWVGEQRAHIVRSVVEASQACIASRSESCPWSLLQAGTQARRHSP